jgi:hypothetical protein
MYHKLRFAEVFGTIVLKYSKILIIVRLYRKVKNLNDIVHLYSDNDI